MELKEKVSKELEKIRPALMGDGGDVKLIEVTDDGEVKVELQGSCRGCPFSQMTLKYGIEKQLKDKIPEVKKVTAV
ncbi:MAG: NifU family protein [Candidatus Celaenobacter antarcticus]|nr:NifU family protein [Candidatus Celaenobacter antarcticus]MDP8315575.1 NifU family protein [Candidatus Celaenobacter antarcticus]